MEEKEIVKFKKGEFAIKEYIKRSLGKGRVSKVRIEYTPVGEKIVVSTHRPGLIIGRDGEKIKELTKILKYGREFKLENPHIDVDEIRKPEFDSQINADDITSGLEALGPMKFKSLAYKTLERIIGSKALGAEIRLSGKLPGARAKTWRFSQGYLKKTGDSAKVVDRAQSIAQTKPGIVGVKVSILSPEAKLKDKINLNDALINKLKSNSSGGKEEKPKNNKVNEKEKKDEK